MLKCEFSPVERRLALKDAAQKDLSSLELDSDQSTEAAKPAVPAASSDTSTSPTRTAHRTLQWADILIGPPPQFSRSEAPPPTPDGALWNEFSSLLHVHYFLSMSSLVLCLEMVQMSQSSSNSWGGAASCSTTPLASFSPSPADEQADSPEGFERKRRKRVRDSNL